MAKLKTNEKLQNHTKKVTQSHKVSENDLWFQRQVEIALIEANSSNTTWIEHEEVRARIKQRAHKRLLEINQ